MIYLYYNHGILTVMEGSYLMKKSNNNIDIFTDKQKETISKTLINLRELRSLSQIEVAKHLHLSSSAISHYERGLTVPPTEVVYRLAEFYNVTTDYILGRTASKKDLNKSYAIKLNKEITIGDAVEAMSKMTSEEKQHIAYFVKLIKDKQ